MNDYHDRPDGEYPVDKASTVIASVDQWGSLSVNQLLEVQVQLQNKLWEFRSHEVIAKQLQTKLETLQGLISKRLLENR